MASNYQFSEHKADECSAKKRTELFYKYVIPHKNLVYKLCIQYSYFPSEIEDNYNQALTNFFKYIETYDPTRSLQTWLHIVTKRFIIDLNNKQKRFKRNEDVDISDFSEILGENDPTANYLTEKNYPEYYNDCILRSLELIKPIYKEALLLQQAGYTLNEIMEISYKNGNLKTKNIETVKSRLFLAKQQLRKLITRDGEERKE